MSTALSPARRQLVPLVGWVITLAAALLSIPLTGDTVWARGVLDGGSEVTATQGLLVAVAGYEATVILAFAGLGAAVFFGLAAAPWSRATRWALTAVVAAVVLAGVVVTVTQEQDASSGELIGALVVSLVPAALLLLLAWRRWRLTSAVIALVAVAVGVVAHAITLVRLLTSAGSPALGAWAMGGLLLVALAATGWVVRSLARVDPARAGSAA